MQQLYPHPRHVPDPVSIYDDLVLPPEGEPPGDRPYVAANMVSTLDGRATAAGRVHEIGSDLDHRLMRKVRAAVDAVLRGAGTVRSNPKYPGVPPEDVVLRRRKGLADQPRLVILSRSLDLPWDSRLVGDAPERPIVFTGEEAGAARLAEARRHAEVHVFPGDQVPIRQALSLLRSRYGIRSVLCEGGPTVNWLLLEAGCLDEYFWTAAPKFSGGPDDLATVEGPRPLGLVRFQLVSAFVHEDELFLRYRRAAGPSR
ncbi:MAG: dihydrofolate reductase family protein [Thermaerobacter sp.]|nr:deaminase [Bacillota bacterium]REJ34661.1 MAG: deaminase [Bacillota bacterium]